MCMKEWIGIEHPLTINYSPAMNPSTNSLSIILHQLIAAHDCKRNKGFKMRDGCSIFAKVKGICFDLVFGKLLDNLDERILELDFLPIQTLQYPCKASSHLGSGNLPSQLQGWHLQFGKAAWDCPCPFPWLSLQTESKSRESGGPGCHFDGSESF